MIKVLIAEAHPIIRQGLQELLQETGEIVVAGEASNGMEVLKAISKTDYDLILLDSSLPDRSGTDILRWVKREKPDLNVLVLGAYPEEQYAVRALKEGASGYLAKERAPEELLTAIRKIASGEKYVSSSLAGKFVFDLKARTAEPEHEALSEKNLTRL
ncbi:response regulator transcription factor [candidate division KSB1 bacterium]|nr:response regulator transcription factor [candidate division KSB1 bacterium]